MKVLTAKEEKDIDASWGEGRLGIMGCTEMGLEEWAGFGDGVLMQGLACGSQGVERSEPGLAGKPWGNSGAYERLSPRPGGIRLWSACQGPGSWFRVRFLDPAFGVFDLEAWGEVYFTGACEMT